MKGLVLAIALVLGVCTAARPVDVNSPLHVNWTVTPSHTIEGRVYNDFNASITKIRLLVEALDASNGVVGTKLGYVFGTLAPGDSRYFDVRNVPPADHYRVAVESYVQERGPS